MAQMMLMKTREFYEVDARKSSADHEAEERILHVIASS